MIYEFECAKGHVTEAMVKMGTEHVVCDTCLEGLKVKPLTLVNGEPIIGAHNPIAHRIMSATRTTFVFADTGKRIRHIKESARKVREINKR